ncbi:MULTISPECIES: MFS transporter [unclassified Streptomyces]|uniref:MFS transporter n=1 Tax=unclassified Streptomyces TaxID=2593676 RepID=UPI001F03B9FA|nr:MULTISPECIES: MFS transporter [unclassified Streptomyces]MCH0565946.1 MFS transporter [Streptomyces sp. MUM 2J]MCH0569111.1 MFS transporter [Streptomyces sp. MUM 136J]
MSVVQPLDTARPAAPPVRRPLVLVITCLALGAVVAAMASLNVALPNIARETHGSQTQLSWIIDAYSLAFASLLLPAGALGDRFGRRRALLAGLAIFGAGSGAAALTTDPTTLIALRAVLGAGAALVMPATLSTITSTFSGAQRTRAVSVWAAVAGASAVVGILASGLLLELWSWPSVFVLNVALSLAALVGTLLYVPESAEPDTARIDVVGVLLSVVCLALVVYSVIEAPTRGWHDASTLGGIGLGLAFLAVFVVWELRRPSPLLDPRLFRNRRFTAGSLSMTLVFFGFFGFIFVIMQYLQMVRGDSALVAAVSMLPLSVGMVPSSRLSPRLTARFGARGPWVAGLLAVALGMGTLAQIDARSSYWLIATALFSNGLGMGLAMTPATTAITGALPRALQNVGSAMNDLTRELGGALGIAVLGSILSATYRDGLDLTGVPPHVAAAARSSLAAANAVGGPVADQARTAFLDGMRFALLGSSAVALLAVVAVSVLLRRPERAPK